jgi:hypothetical protein
MVSICNVQLCDKTKFIVFDQHYALASRLSALDGKRSSGVIGACVCVFLCVQVRVRVCTCVYVCLILRLCYRREQEKKKKEKLKMPANKRNSSASGSKKSSAPAKKNKKNESGTAPAETFNTESFRPFAKSSAQTSQIAKAADSSPFEFGKVTAQVRLGDEPYQNSEETKEQQSAPPSPTKRMYFLARVHSTQLASVQHYNIYPLALNSPCTCNHALKFNLTHQIQTASHRCVVRPGRNYDRIPFGA